MRCVAVIIFNWNDDILLAMCLQDLEQLTISFLFVMETMRVLIIPLPASAKVFANVTTQRMICNPGLAAGNYVVFTRSDTDFVTFLSPLAFPETNSVQSLLSATFAQPKVSAFGSFQLCEGTQGVFDEIGDNYLIIGRVGRKAINFKKCLGNSVMEWSR